MAAGWPPWAAASSRVRRVLSLMAYQIGCRGVIEFRDMLGALARKDYQAAHAAGLESEWAKETPIRATSVLAPLLK